MELQHEVDVRVAAEHLGKLEAGQCRLELEVVIDLQPE